MSAAIAEFFTKQGNNTYVLIHRDRDCLLDDELEWCTKKDIGKLPERCEVFFTPLNDIEHSFCQPAQIAAAFDIGIGKAQEIIDTILDQNQSRLAIEFGNKRQDLKAKYLRGKDDVPSATDLAPVRVSFAQCRGKTLWGLLNQFAMAQHFNANRLQTTDSSALKIVQLSAFAARVWPSSDSN